MFQYDNKKMEEAIRTYMENDFWREVYEGAPSDVCKRYFRLSFYSSLYNEPKDEERKEMRERIYSKLDVADWKYLKKVHPSSPFTKLCDDKIVELQTKELFN